MSYKKIRMGANGIVGGTSKRTGTPNPSLLYFLRMSITRRVVKFSGPSYQNLSKNP